MHRPRAAGLVLLGPRAPRQEVRLPGPLPALSGRSVGVAVLGGAGRLVPHVFPTAGRQAGGGWISELVPSDMLSGCHVFIRGTRQR